MRFLFIIGLWLTAHSLLAQSTTIDSTTQHSPPERTLEFSYTYMNPVSYRGRTFGMHQWGMIPQVTYRAPSGWNLYGAGYIWNDYQTSQLSKVDLGVEKEGTLGRHFTYALGYERWFFLGLDPDDTTPLNNFTEATISGEWNDWNPSIGAYYMFGSAQLLQTDVELSRYVGLYETPRLSLFTEPVVRATFANQSLIINGLYQLPTDMRQRRLQPAESRPFGLVAGEVSVPVTAQTARWRFVADPRLVQPYNTLTGERKRAFFYYVGTLTYTLKLK